MRPALQLVNTETGEVTDACPNCAELEDKLAGYKRTVDKQARDIGGLERRLKVEEDPANHPQGKEIASLIDRWKAATGHPKAKASKDRFDVVKARIKDGYKIEDLELAVDGIATFPFVVNGQRVREGKPSQRHDALTIALKGGENTERFAVLGYQARKQGWVTWE